LTWAVAESSRRMSLISALEQADALDGAAGAGQRAARRGRLAGAA